MDGTLGSREQFPSQGRVAQLAEQLTLNHIR